VLELGRTACACSLAASADAGTMGGQSAQPVLGGIIFTRDLVGLHESTELCPAELRHF
jgi:hypothetical protein